MTVPNSAGLTANSWTPSRCSSATVKLNHCTRRLLLLVVIGLTSRSQAFQVSKAKFTRTSPSILKVTSVVPEAPPGQSKSKFLLDLDSPAVTQDADLPAPDGSTQTTSHTSSIVPSYRKLLLFCTGPLAIWLTEPFLSLVDTTVVGLFGSTLQLAAMGPATNLMDLSLYMTYFLALATTTQITKAVSEKDYRQCQKSTSQMGGVAVLLGAAVTVAMWKFGRSLVSSIIGAGAPAALSGYAVRYCWIRAAVAPAAVLGMVAQAVCLSTQDIKTPITAVTVASIVNILGDFLLRGFGLQGAAFATAVSTLASTSVLLRALRKKMQNWRKLELEAHETAILESSMTYQNSTFAFANSTVSTSQELVLEGKPQIPFFSLPSRRSLLKLVRLSLPLAFNMWAKYACYFALTVRASAFGTTALASHNIMMRVFYFLGSFSDALGQAAQSFIPAALYPVERKKEFHAILRKISVLAIGVSALSFVGSRSILLSCGTIFTKDSTILSCIRKTAIWPAVCLALHPIAVSISGTVIATRNLRNLVKVYAVTALTHMALLQRASSFSQVWQTLVAFQVVRLVNYLFWSKATPRKQESSL